MLNKNLFCVYLTTYKGNKIPPFYIGSGNLTNINKKSKPYLGTVTSKEYKTIWESEIKYNRNLFKLQVIKTFPTRSEAFDYERKIHIKLDVVRNPLYINKSIAGSTFNMYGSKHTPETKSQMSKTHLSQHRKFSQEEIEHLSLVSKNTIVIYDNNLKINKKVDMDSVFKENIESGVYQYLGTKRTQESRNKTSVILSDRIHCHNPITGDRIFIKKYETIPENYVIGLPEEFSNIMSEISKDSKFYHNPITKEQTRLNPNVNPIPKGFIEGRIDFGVAGNQFSNSLFGIDVRTKLKNNIPKINPDRVYIIPYAVKSILNYKNMFTCSNEKMVNYLKTESIVISEDKLSRMKREGITSNVEYLKPIYVSDYQYNENDIWF